MAKNLSDAPNANTVIDNVKTGFKVLGNELKLLASEAFACHETKQMSKRLTKEYAALGALARRHMESDGKDKAALDPKGEAGIILTQIAFLEQEIDKVNQDCNADQGNQKTTSPKNTGCND